MIGDDVTLVREMSEGDAGAMSHFYDRHAAGVYSVCAKLAGDPKAAEALLADTFHELWRRAKLIDGAHADPAAAVMAIAKELARSDTDVADVIPVDPPHEAKSEVMTRVARDQDAVLHHRPVPDPHDPHRWARRTAQAFTAIAAIVLIAVLVNRWTNFRIEAAREEVRRDYETRLMQQKLQTLMLQTRLERLDAPASQPSAEPR